MQTDERDEEYQRKVPENAQKSMRQSREQDSNVSDESRGQPPKHSLPSCSTEDGTQTDKSDEQAENAHFPIPKSLDPGSNVSVESDRHPTKHSWQSISTLEGIQIDERDEQSRNAAYSIRESVEPHSKVTADSPSQSAKHPAPNFVTLFAIRNSLPFPEYRVIEPVPELTRRSPSNLRTQFSSEIETEPHCP
jgi:hypothetical protein